MDDSLYIQWLHQSHAIPCLPAFNQVNRENATQQPLSNPLFPVDSSVNWEKVLTYQHPFNSYQNTNHPIFTGDTTVSTSREIVPIEHKTYNDYKHPNFILSIIILLLIILAWIKSAFQRYLSRFVNATISYSESYRLYSEQNAMVSNFFRWLDGIFLIIFSFLIYLVCRQFQIFNTFSSIKLYALSFLISSGFLLYKLIVIKFSGWLLYQRELFNEYLFHNLLYYQIAAIFIFPLLMIVAFAGSIISQYLIYSAIGIFILFQLFIYFRGTTIILKKGVLFFYWILYLCTVEILPFLLLYTYLSKQV
jgi:hypothetical protein